MGKIKAVHPYRRDQAVNNITTSRRVTNRCGTDAPIGGQVRKSRQTWAAPWTLDTAWKAMLHYPIARRCGCAERPKGGLCAAAVAATSVLSNTPRGRSIQPGRLSPTTEFAFDVKLHSCQISSIRNPFRPPSGRLGTPPTHFFSVEDQL
jgi:hypothetical protein